MKTKPPSSPLRSGRRIARKRRGSPTRWNRTFRSRLEKASLDDLISGIGDLSLARPSRPATPQTSATKTVGLGKITTPQAPGTSLTKGKGKETEQDDQIPRPALVPHAHQESGLDQDLQIPDPFRNPVEIPLAAGVLAYPHSASAISGEFENRFREIQNYFRRNTENHPDLRAHVEHIEYVLKMCGPSIDESHPSIIVFCRPSEFKPLRSLLNEKHLKRQWCRRKSSPSYLFWKAWGKSDAASNLGFADNKPLFDLYFWRTAQPRNFLCLESTSVCLRMGKPSPLTLSGTVMTIPHPDGQCVACSTIACTLQVDGSFYALTAAHVLHKISKISKLQSGEYSPDASVQSLEHVGFGKAASGVGSQHYESSDDWDDDDFVSDIEYDDEPESNLTEVSVEPTTRDQERAMEQEGPKQIIRTAVAKASACLGGWDVPDLDWAVLELDSADLRRPNAFVSTSHTKSQTETFYFSKIIPGLPGKETAVLVHTSHGIRKAMLQSAPAYLGGINYRPLEPASYWTLIVCDGESLSHGDSGSVVIDAVTHGAYGHVVASNPLGEIYVSPMMSTMDQIKSALKATDVVLPEPLTAITKLSCHHLDQQNDDAFRILAELDGLIKSPNLRGISRKQLRSWEQSPDRQTLSLLASTALSRTTELDAARSQVLRKFVLRSHVHLPNFRVSTPPRSLAPVVMHPEPQDSVAGPPSPRLSPSKRGDPGDPSLFGGRVYPAGETLALDMQTYLAQRRLLFPETTTASPSMPRTPIAPRDLVVEFDLPMPQPQPRRNSMDEDVFYRELMTSRPQIPPSYQATMSQGIIREQQKAPVELISRVNSAGVDNKDEAPPEYACDIHLEGVFMRKMEIEQVSHRARQRNWQMVYAELHGARFTIYNVKKERGWWLTKKDESLAPDNPPWVKKGPAERSYSLLHGDVGIAADYKKRRYVIRLRLEDEQFLLSCVELGTFVTWLGQLFAAIDIAPPIDERDFPRDHSIPRVQRLRWMMGSRGGPNETEAISRPRIQNESAEESESEGDEVADTQERRETWSSPIVGRLPANSITVSINITETGKWAPTHEWTTTHDLLYAKLCYSVLLFKSPRRSNYVIRNGKRWYVDWATGRMVRVLPPGYDELELYGPWQVVSAPNRAI